MHSQSVLKFNLFFLTHAHTHYFIIVRLFSQVYSYLCSNTYCRNEMAVYELRFVCPSAATKSTDLFSEIPHSTLIESLRYPLTQVWVTPHSTLTLFLIKTGERGGADWTHSHQ